MSHLVKGKRTNIVRPIALCLVKYQDRILVGKGYDSKTKREFYRLLGGGIEIGELGKDAVKREFKEELNAKLIKVKYLTTVENIFFYNGILGHEIILLFAGTLAEMKLFAKANKRILDVEEDHEISWQNINSFKRKKLTLYPEIAVRYL